MSAVWVTPDQRNLIIISRLNSSVYKYSLPDLRLTGSTKLNGLGAGWMTITPDAPVPRLVAIANYVFSGLAHDAFALKAGRLREYVVVATPGRLIDHLAKPAQFAEAVKCRALALAAVSDRPSEAKGVALSSLARVIDAAGIHYEFVDVQIDRDARRAVVCAPSARPRA